MSGNKTPSLDELTTNPSRVANLPQEAAQLLLIQLASIHSLLIQRALMATQKGQADLELLTVPEVAKLLKISEYKTYDLIRHGEIKKTSIGDSVRVKPSDLAAYIDRNRDCAETAIASILGGSTKG